MLAPLPRIGRQCRRASGTLRTSVSNGAKRIMEWVILLRVSLGWKQASGQIQSIERNRAMVLSESILTQKKALGEIQRRISYLRGKVEAATAEITRGLVLLNEDLAFVKDNLQSLSTAITSATSDSGTGTEGLKFPTGTLGGSQAKSIEMEPTGSDGPSMGESLD